MAKMGSKSNPGLHNIIVVVVVVVVFMILQVVGFVRSDVTSDRKACQDELISLSTCLPYVGGGSKAPVPGCCTPLKQVLATSKKCLCILVRDSDDPALGLKINATLALGLPAICKAKANVGNCPALLNLAPNSPEARVFEDFQNMGNGTTTPTPSSSTGTKGSPSPAGGSSSSTTTKNAGQRVTSIDGVWLWCWTLFLFMAV